MRRRFTDWKRWSPAERILAVLILCAIVLLQASAML
jgi:hypothetical protein